MPVLSGARKVVEATPMPLVMASLVEVNMKLSVLVESVMEPSFSRAVAVKVLLAGIEVRSEGSIVTVRRFTTTVEVLLVPL